MPKRESAPIERTHVWLFSDDLRWLRETYGSTLGVAKAVRTIVRGFRQKVEERQRQIQDNSPPLNITLEDLANDHDALS